MTTKPLSEPTPAAIIGHWGDILAVINTVMPSGSIEYSWEYVIDEPSGKALLVNAQAGKLTRSRAVLNSREAKLAYDSAQCVSYTLRRFLILDNMTERHDA